LGWIEISKQDYVNIFEIRLDENSKSVYEGNMRYNTDGISKYLGYFPFKQQSILDF